MDSDKQLDLGVDPDHDADPEILNGILLITQKLSTNSYEFI